MKNKKPLGEILISYGFISVEHIIRARYKQINSAQKTIGECLLELGYINKHQLAFAIKKQSQLNSSDTVVPQCFT